MGLIDQTASALPGGLDLLCQRGHTLRLNGQFAQAEHAYRDVLVRDPRHVDAAAALAFMLREAGHLYGASAVMLASWRARAKDVVESEKTAHFLRECEAWEEVLEVCSAQLALTPGHVRLLAFAGDAAVVLGRFARASGYLREALDGNPNLARPWLRLSQTLRYERSDDPDVQRFRAAFGNADLAEPARTCAGFALGKALDDLADYAGAVAVFTAANRMARRQTKWSAAEWQGFVANRCAARALPAATFDPGFVPVFIIGLPRSGTTMLTRMLERHAQVRNRGELNWADAFARHLQARTDAEPAYLIERISRMFAAQLRRDDEPAHFYIDKNPLNFRYLDVIAALFPNARVIHCRRDRHDVALSLWCQHFAHEDMGFAYDFDDIAAFADGYLRLMRHWRPCNPLPIFDVDYEALVSAPDVELARVAVFLGLDPGGANRVHARPSRDAIATASVWQARQPNHTGSIGRWHRYKALLPAAEAAFPDN